MSLTINNNSNNLINTSVNTKKSTENKQDYKKEVDKYKVEFHYYKKPENSQPITTKNMQKFYQGLEDRARQTYYKIHKSYKDDTINVNTKKEESPLQTFLASDTNKDKDINQKQKSSLDKYKVEFHYYKKPKNSQPITTKSMQKFYQGLEDRAKRTYLMIHKAQEYAENYMKVAKDENTTKDDLRALYYSHIKEMNSIN